MGYTLINIDAYAEEERPRTHWRLWLAAIFAGLVAGFLHWGGYLVQAGDSLPDHLDAAVVLQGPAASERARVTEAMALLQQGSAGRVALSVPRESPWGEEVAPAARRYLEKNYSAELAAKVEFCATPADVKSEEQEAQAVGQCVQEHGWKTIALVTSNYNGRRAKMVWRKTPLLQDPPVQVWVDGVPDPGYQPRGWWRQSPYAKVWFMEVTKMAWSVW